MKKSFSEQRRAIKESIRDLERELKYIADTTVISYLNDRIVSLNETLALLTHLEAVHSATKDLENFLK